MSNKEYDQYIASDIFNRQYKTIVSEKPHKRNVLNVKTDVFNESKIEKDNKLRSRSNNSQSDIFFNVPIKPKPDHRDRRNISNRSVVFSHLNSKDYVVNRPKNDKPYEPLPDPKREMTPVKRRLNELYSQEELNYSDVNQSTCSLSSRGFLQKEEASYNPIKKIRDCVNKRKCIWELEQAIYDQNNQLDKRTASGNANADSSSANETSTKRSKIKDIKSNIFNDKTKERINKANMTMIDNDEVKLYFESNYNTQPKKYYHSKWISKLDWRSPQTELLFKNMHDKEEEKLSAFQRKHSQLYGSVPSLNHQHYQCLKHEDLMEKESIDSYSSRINKGQDRQRRLNDNVSSCFSNNNSFYEKTMQYSTNNPIEHEYQIKEAKGVDPTDIKKMFEQKGIQVYNILDNSSVIFGKISYRFKIRENDKEGFNKALSEVCEAMKKEKGIDVQAIQKITVNKKKFCEVQLSNDSQFPKEDLKKTTMSNNDIKVRHKGKGGEDAAKFKKKFSSEFNSINNNYKNNGIRKFIGHN